MSSCLLRDCDRAKYFTCEVQLCCSLAMCLGHLMILGSLIRRMDKNMIVLKKHYFIIPNVITECHMIVAILKFCLMF